MLQVHVLV